MRLIENGMTQIGTKHESKGPFVCPRDIVKVVWARKRKNQSSHIVNEHLVKDVLVQRLAQVE